MQRVQAAFGRFEKQPALCIVDKNCNDTALTYYLYALWLAALSHFDFNPLYFIEDTDKS